MGKPESEIAKAPDGQNMPDQIDSTEGMDDDFDLHMYYHSFYGF